MTIYFVRHGESVANEQNFYAGKLNSPLTHLGRRQAKQAADYIRRLGLRFDEVHISTLERAQETAKIILEGCEPGAPRIVHAPTLIERDFGIFGGVNKTLIKKALGHKRYDRYFHDSTGTPPNGESWMAMYERCKAYYEQVLAPLERQGKQVLVVTHKYIVEIFALIASGRSPDEYIDFKVPNSRPVSWDELKRLTANSSSTLNYIGEHIEIHLQHWMLGAALCGFVLSLVHRTILLSWAHYAVALLLAINTFFVALRIDPEQLRSRPGPQRAALVLGVLRLVVGGALLICCHSLEAYLIGLFLLVPPALSVPTFSLARGGDYFFAARNTLILSVVSPLLLLAAYVLWPQAFSEFGMIGQFFALLIFAVVLPVVFAQRWRHTHPIKAGSTSTNWGWVSAAAMVPLAFLSAYLAGGWSMIDAMRAGDWRFDAALFMPVVVLYACRVVSGLYLRIQARFSGAAVSTPQAIDLHLLQTSPNIFLWLSLLAPALIHQEPMVMGGVLGFFFFVFMTEAFIVKQFGIWLFAHPALRTERAPIGTIRTDGATL